MQSYFCNATTYQTIRIVIYVSICILRDISKYTRKRTPQKQVSCRDLIFNSYKINTHWIFCSSCIELIIKR